MTAPAKPGRKTPAEARMAELSPWPLTTRKVRDLLVGDHFDCSVTSTSACVVVHIEPHEPRTVLLVCDAHSATMYGWDDEVMAVTPPPPEPAPAP